VVRLSQVEHGFKRPLGTLADACKKEEKPDTPEHAGATGWTSRLLALNDGIGGNGG
jgi:hypothetical protein